MTVSQPDLAVRSMTCEPLNQWNSVFVSLVSGGGCSIWALSASAVHIRCYPGAGFMLASTRCL